MGVRRCVRRPGLRRGPGPGLRRIGREWYRGTGIAQVLGWWFDPKPGRNRRPLPLPAWSAPDRVLADPPPDWLPAAISWPSTTATSRSPCRFELFGGGRTWLGPEWARASERPGRPGVATPAVALGHRLRGRPGRMDLSRRGWLGSPDPRCSCAAGAWRCSRSWPRVEVRAGRRARRLRLTMPAGRRGRAAEGVARLALAGSGRRGSAQVLPIALPCLPVCHRSRVVPGRGAGIMALTQAPAGRRGLAPLARLLGPEPQSQARELAGLDRLGTIAGRSPGSGVRRAGELGARRDLRRLSQPRPARPAAFLGHQTAPGSSSPSSRRMGSSSRSSPWNDLRRSSRLAAAMRVRDEAMTASDQPM